MTAVRGRAVVGLDTLRADRSRLVLDTAEPFKEVSERPIKKVPALRGKTIVNLFFEASTRTRISFEFAEKRLSADTVNVAASGSSVSKGETLVDTARNLEAMRIDMVVIRHPSSGAAEFLGDRIASNVINAGDGKHEHPTQALLDLLTIRDKHGKIEGLKVCLVGDVLHSRVARSNLWGLTKLGAEVAVCGPWTLLPRGIEELGVKVFGRIEEAIEWADVLNVLRLQLERMEKGFIRSSWSRSTFSTSAHSIASSMRPKTFTPSSSMPRGSSVHGPHTATSAPSFVRPHRFDRATRECSTSPTRQTFRPSIFPCLSRIVSRSSSACVGCSCFPSPALITLESMRLPRNSAAPEEGCRITTMSIRIASRLRAVSTSVSPFWTALPLAATLTVSAERRFSANSNEMRVRVEASKNRLTMVLPRSAGTFLMGRSETSLKGSAVSRMRRVLLGDSRSRPTRSFPRVAVMAWATDPPRLSPRAPRPARPRAPPRSPRPSVPRCPGRSAAPGPPGSPSTTARSA